MDLFLSIVKWPLIVCSFIGIVWLIWKIFWDEKDEGKLEEYLFFSAWFDAPPPHIGLTLILLVSVAFAIAVYFQLPVDTQAMISDYWRRADAWSAAFFNRQSH